MGIKSPKSKVWSLPLISGPGLAFGRRFPLPFGRGEGQGEGLSEHAGWRICHFQQFFSPSPRPSPPPWGRGRLTPRLSCFDSRPQTSDFSLQPPASRLLSNV